MPSNESLAYCAGILDGEGYVGIVNRPNRKPYVSIQISMTNYECLKFVYDTIPNGKMYMPTWAKRHGYKQTYQLQYNSSNTRDFLRLVLPWLIVKKLKAEQILAMDFSRRNV